METYRLVKQQIAVLERKAAELRRAEATKVIADIKKKIAKFELQPEDLFDVLPTAASTPVKTQRSRPAGIAKLTPKAVAKYQDPVSGKTWTGRGKTPNWLKAKDREAFLIGGPSKAKAEVKKSVAPAKKAVASKPPTTAKAVKKPVARKPATKKPAAPSTTEPLEAVSAVDSPTS